MDYRTHPFFSKLVRKKFNFVMYVRIRHYNLEVYCFQASNIFILIYCLFLRSCLWKVLQFLQKILKSVYIFKLLPHLYLWCEYIHTYIYMLSNLTHIFYKAWHYIFNTIGNFVIYLRLVYFFFHFWYVI